MSEQAPDEWVASWFEYHRLSSGTREQRKALELGQPVRPQAAWAWVEDRIMDGGDDAIQVIETLALRASSEGEEMAVGIGPVESLIYEHGDSVVDSLLDRARRSPPLARALRWVSLASGSVSDTSLSKLAIYQNGQK
jgi:hypothetical protein